MQRFLPTFIKFVHKLAVLERFSFSRFTRVNTGKRQVSRQLCTILFLAWEIIGKIRKKYVDVARVNAKLFTNFHQICA